MRKHNQLFALFFFIFTPLISLEHQAYIQLSSSTTQIPNLTTTSLILCDSYDLIKNFDVIRTKDNKIEKIICKVSGVYFINTGLQPAILNSFVSGYLDSWFLINDQIVPASNSRQYVTQDSLTTLISNTFILELKENDTFSIGFTASGPGIGLIFIQDSLSNEPNIESFGITIFKID